jgi:hypothetical protein
MVLTMALGLAASILPLYGQDNDAEAARFNAAGKAALKDNDFDIAARNFERAATLAPNNALIRLNLATVQNKLGNVTDARANVKRALDIGLDGAALTHAQDLQGELDYKAEKIDDASNKLSPFTGAWTSAGGREFALGGLLLGCQRREAWTHRISLSSDGSGQGNLQGTDNTSFDSSDFQVSVTFGNRACDSQGHADAERDWKMTLGSNGTVQLDVAKGFCRGDSCYAFKLVERTFTIKLRGGEMLLIDDDGSTYGTYQRVSRSIPPGSSPAGTVHKKGKNQD